MPRSPKRCRWLCTVCSRYNDPECEVCELSTCRLSKRVVGITVSSPKATRRGPRYDKAPKGAVPLSAAPHTVSRRTKPAEEPEAAPRTKRVKRVHGEPSSSNQGKGGRWSSDEADEAKPPTGPKGAGARSVSRGQYHCKRCGLPKRGHVCLADAITAGSDEGDYDDDASDDRRRDVLVDVTNWRHRDVYDTPSAGRGCDSAYVKRLDANALPVRLRPVKLDEETPETPRRATPATTTQRRGSLRPRVQPAEAKLVPVTLRKTTPSDSTWGAYWAIVAEVLPNVPTERLMVDAHAFSLVLVESRGGKEHVVGGTTFRLLHQEEGGKTRLVLDILLLAISASVQGRGHGSGTVLALKRLALEHAIAHGQHEALLLTQADNLAVTFWSKHGCALPCRRTPPPYARTPHTHPPHALLPHGARLPSPHRSPARARPLPHTRAPPCARAGSPADPRRATWCTTSRSGTRRRTRSTSARRRW